MSKWIEFSLDERKAMIQGVVEARQIDEAAAEKDWWVTAVLYALFHTSVSEYLLFKRAWLRRRLSVRRPRCRLSSCGGGR